MLLRGREMPGEDNSSKIRDQRQCYDMERTRALYISGDGV